MTLVKYAPMRELCGSGNRLDQIFDSFLSDTWGGTGADLPGWAPRVDVEETKDGYTFRADLPGMNKEDITISVEDHRLVIKGERQSAVEQKTSKYHRVERHHGSFCRTFRLPATVISDRVEASYRQGVLEITVPKAEEVKPKAIEIKN